MKRLKLLIVFILLSCIVENEGDLQDQLSSETNQGSNNSKELNIPESSTIETTLNVTKKIISPLWEEHIDILDGEVKDIGVFNDQIYVFGDQFGIKGYEDAYEQYSAGNGESIYYYIEQRNFTRSFDAFIRNYSLNGSEIDTKTIDFNSSDRFQRFGNYDDAILFSLSSSGQPEGVNSSTHIGILSSNQVQILDSLDENIIGYQFLNDVILEFSLDRETHLLSTRLLSYSDNDDSGFVVIAESIPDMSYRYRIDNELWGIDTSYRKIESFVIGEESKQIIDVSFNNPIFEKIQVGNLKTSFARVFQFGYLNRERDYTGFYWTAYDHGTTPKFYYFMSDNSVLFTNLYVAEDGFFITGQEYGKMLLLFLNLDGELQWKTHFREGILRGIVQQNGRYYIAGDYNIQVSEKDGDWGTDYLYLAEIDVK